jgi:glucose-6-phosphate 1-dehydrogenase
VPARGADTDSPALEPNPLREGSLTLQTPEPCCIVVFGATGDLTKRKLIPALLRLSAQKCLHPRTAIVGVSRRELTDEAFREELHAATLDEKSSAAGAEAAEWPRFAERLRYQTGSFEDPALFDTLAQRLQATERERGLPGNRIYYLAVPPAAFEPILRHLARPGFVPRHHAEAPWARVVIEKPFGHDLESARELNALSALRVRRAPDFRIDHYLARERSELLVLRLANGIFEPLWNKVRGPRADHGGGIDRRREDRAGYYEHAGVSRDISSKSP